ncbi:hypothetical protein CBOM_04562 [Ceraceosorus bombacis]|uniref:Uncharacterized protein n=1 Tax=Ceraceosorus bombacis TaxID=401625 RepID=A0A0P1BMP4_9BASI|nr:hypothetical protein CBOM_04562 [Ceraceosorus bombacis]
MADYLPLFVSSGEKIEAEMQGSPSNLVSIAKKPAHDVPPNQHSFLEHEGVRYPSPERKEYQEEFRRVYTPPLTADSERVQAYYEDLKKKMTKSGAWGTPRIKHALGYAPELHTGFMHGRVHEIASKRILDEHSDIIKGGGSGLRSRALSEKLVDPRTALRPLSQRALVKRELAQILSFAKKPAKGIPEIEHSLLGHAGRPPLTLKDPEMAHAHNDPTWGYTPPATNEDVNFSYERMKNFMKQQGGWGTPSFHKSLDEFILGIGKWFDAGQQARERIIKEHLSNIHAAGQMHPLSHMYPETNPPVKGVSAALRKLNEPLHRRSDHTGGTRRSAQVKDIGRIFQKRSVGVAQYRSRNLLLRRAPLGSRLSRFLDVLPPRKAKVTCLVRRGSAFSCFAPSTPRRSSSPVHTTQAETGSPPPRVHGRKSRFNWSSPPLEVRQEMETMTGIEARRWYINEESRRARAWQTSKERKKGLWGGRKRVEFNVAQSESVVNWLGPQKHPDREIWQRPNASEEIGESSHP